MKNTMASITIALSTISSSSAAITAVTGVDSLTDVGSVTTSLGTVNVTTATIRSYGAGNFNTGSPAFGTTSHAQLNDTSILSGIVGSSGITNGSFSLDFGGLVTDNDSALDFFVFEDGGNDAGSIYAILEDGTLSSALAFDFTVAAIGSDLTGATGVLSNNGTNLTGRAVHGFGFDLTDLGITSGTAIQGIVIDTGSSLDAYHIVANVEVVPEPSSTALLGLGGLALILRRRK